MQAILPAFIRSNIPTIIKARLWHTAALLRQLRSRVGIILQARAQHFDLVLNGVELGGGSIRNHDPAVQLGIIENILQVCGGQDRIGCVTRTLMVYGDVHGSRWGLSLPVHA